jgi:hypothetical protein
MTKRTRSRRRADTPPDISLGVTRCWLKGCNLPVDDTSALEVMLNTGETAVIRFCSREHLLVAAGLLDEIIAENQRLDAQEAASPSVGHSQE